MLKEGKKRQIRHIWEAVGRRVLGLKRVRIGNVLLGAFQTPAEMFSECVALTG